MAKHTEKLRDLLASLPKELYDQIYEETFIATPTFQVISKDPNDKSRFAAKSQLHLLTVDRASRAHFIPSYYANTTFIVYGIETCLDWSKSMPLERFQMTKDIRCVSRRGAPTGDQLHAYLHATVEATGAEMQLYLLAACEDLAGVHNAGPFFNDLIAKHIEAVVNAGYESEVTKDIEGFTMRSTASSES